MTKQDLQNYPRIKKEQAQVKRLLHMVEQRPVAGDKTEKLKAYYTAKLEELAAAQLSIEDAIAALDPTERMILRLRYIEGESWTKIARSVHYSRSRAFDIHNEALRKLADK